jgi:hypothetical protein
MLRAQSKKKCIQCITDTFTEYATDTAITNKNAETTADAIYFGILRFEFNVLFNLLLTTARLNDLVENVSS